MSANKLNFKDEGTLSFIEDYLKENKEIDILAIRKLLGSNNEKYDLFIEKSIILMRQYLVLRQYTESLEAELGLRKKPIGN